jgi:hypothetical protein
MDSGVPLTSSVSATHPMGFNHFMGTDPSVFPNGMKNHDTQSVPWASNHLSLCTPNMSSKFSSSPLPSYMNPSFGSEGLMPTFSTFSFDGNHIPQLTLTMGG